MAHIVFGQTISTPSIVASMVQSLRLTGVESVLDIGSGSGYQSAVLAELAGTVTAMERIPELARRSKEVLRYLGYNIDVINSEDFNDVEGTFDRIIVAAGVKIFPEELLYKLKDGGILVIPIDCDDSHHEIRRIVKKKGNEFFEEIISNCSFDNFSGSASHQSNTWVSSNALILGQTFLLSLERVHQNQK